MKLLYFCPLIRGGLADYSHEQAAALAAAGANVTLLAAPGFPANRGKDYPCELELIPPPAGKAGLPRKVALSWSILRNIDILASKIHRESFRHVLFGSYSEYLAPLWAGKLRALARKGVVFGAVVHDPVRDFVLGPVWWHRRSVSAAYSFLKEAFVHEPIDLDTVRPVPGLRTTVIPHGPYAFPPATSRNVRGEFSIPRSAPVLLAFGHIRDAKNLDLAIRALAQFPEVHLIIAGDVISAAQKPVSHYRRIANAAGVAQRCHWITRFIPREEIADIFAATDAVLLTYSATFRSASGVLHAAASFRKPAIASGGQGNLRTMIRDYKLGIWVDPDSVDALKTGISDWLQQPPAPKWEDYEMANSWRRNAKIVIRHMDR